MHLSSPDLCSKLGDCEDCQCINSNHPPAVLAADAIEALDAAHMSKGVMLSGAYLYGLASMHLPPGEVQKSIRLENEFTAAEVSKYPRRLVGFLSVDPLQDAAVDELRYWAKKPTFAGLKLHFRASSVNIRSAGDREKVGRVLREAAKEHIPMVIHLGGGEFNASDAELFIREVLPNAGDSWVQLAHAGGGMPKQDGNNLQVLRTFGDHIVKDDPRTRHLLFDLSYVPAPDESAEDAAAVAKEIRRIGIKRFLFGSDFNVLMPTEQISNLGKLGLTAEELQTLSQNCAPWAC
jgi:predicted TIM-barrel fold metal-dependent hydrolase